MSNMINPFTDWGFKRLFGREESKPVMIDLLNSILADGREIVDITYENKERTPVGADNRTVIYDIYCTTSDGRHIIVEMQNGRQWFFKERTIFYTTLSVEENGEKGKWNYQFDEVLLIAFLNYKDSRISNRLRTDVMLKDIETNEVFSKCLHLVYLQMPMADNLKEEDCATDFEYWIYNLYNMEKLDELAFKDKKPVFYKLEKMANPHFMTREENVEYQRSLKQMWDYDAVMDGERAFAREEGLAEGRAEGMQQGLEEGRAEGRAEGMQQEKLAIATNLKKLGTPIDIIVQASGLTKEQVDAL